MIKLDLKDEEILDLLSLAKDFKDIIAEKGNSKYIKISSKDIGFLNLRLLLQISKRLNNQDKKIFSNKLKINFLLISIPILVTCIGILISLLNGGIL